MEIIWAMFATIVRNFTIKVSLTMTVMVWAMFVITVLVFQTPIRKIRKTMVRETESVMPATTVLIIIIL